jgi:hypothetical protein
MTKEDLKELTLIKFNFLNKYNVSTGGQLNEDISDKYLLIGHIKNSTVQYATGDYYVFVDTYVPKKDNIEDYLDKAILYNSKPDASGINVPHYPGLKDFVTLLPEYENSYYAHAIFGEPDDMKQQKSNELLETIQQSGGMAILTHNSSKMITNGFVKVGMTPNLYSKSDFRHDSTPRSYFWGNKGGKDVSNTSQTYIYTCELPLDQIYDIQNNINNWSTKDVVNNGYTAVAYYINNIKGNGTVVAVYKDIPIKTIQVAMDSGKIYNANWELIRDETKRD